MLYKNVLSVLKNNFNLIFKLYELGTLYELCKLYELGKLYELCKLNELHKLYELCKLYEYFTNLLKSLEIT